MRVYPSCMRDEKDRQFFRELGERLKRFRAEAGLTQVEVAERLNISQQVYGSYEVGRLRLPASLLPELAPLFGVSIEQIVGLKEPKNKRGPTPRLLQQIEQLHSLPRAKQKFVSEFLDTILSQAS